MTFEPVCGPSKASAFAVALLGVVVSGSSNSTFAEVGTKAPTYSADVEPILRTRCLECHRPGQIGPFALSTYEQASKRAEDLASVAEERRMPPWKPTPGFGPKLKHDRSMPRSEIETLRAWADSGAARGLDRVRPPDPVVDDWKLGKPDFILEPSEEFLIPASGPDIHRCFVIPTSLAGDAYVSAVEYRPGNARVVHHVMAFVETAEAGRKRDEADPGLGYESYSGAGVEVFGDLGGWAPGNEPSRLPEGVGRSLPKGADVILQVHYHPDGKPEVDRTRIGLYLSRGPVRQTLQWKGVMTRGIRLEPGEADTNVKASWMVPVNVEALAIALTCISSDGR